MIPAMFVNGSLHFLTKLTFLLTLILEFLFSVSTFTLFHEVVVFQFTFWIEYNSKIIHFQFPLDDHILHLLLK